MEVDPQQSFNLPVQQRRNQNRGKSNQAVMLLLLTCWDCEKPKTENTSHKLT